MVSKKNIQFTNELESNAKVPFLDVLLIRNDGEWMKKNKKINIGKRVIQMFVYTETLSRQYHWWEGYWKL